MNPKGVTELSLSRLLLQEFPGWFTHMHFDFLSRLLPPKTRLNRRSRTNRTSLDGVTHIRLQSSAIGFRGGKLRQGGDIAHQPESCCINARAHRGIAAFETNQRRNGDAESFLPRRAEIHAVSRGRWPDSHRAFAGPK